MPNISVNTNFHTRVRNIVLEMQAGAGGSTKHAETAQRLETPRKIKLVGDINGSVEFDGSADAYINTTINRITDADIDTVVVYDPSGDHRITEDEIDDIISGDDAAEDTSDDETDDGESEEKDVRISEEEIDAIINS